MFKYLIVAILAGAFLFGVFRTWRSYLRWERFRKVPDNAIGVAHEPSTDQRSRPQSA